MEKEICMVCPKLMCVNEEEGRRMFFADKGSQELKTFIQDCSKYCAVAVLGTLHGKVLLYQENLNGKIPQTTRFG
jgi:hypothetical protein